MVASVFCVLQVQSIYACGCCVCCEYAVMRVYALYIYTQLCVYMLCIYMLCKHTCFALAVVACVVSTQVCVRTHYSAVRIYAYARITAYSRIAVCILTHSSYAHARILTHTSYAYARITAHSRIAVCILTHSSYAYARITTYARIAVCVVMREYVSTHSCLRLLCVL